MSSFPWLTAVAVLPLLGAVAVWVLPRGAVRYSRHVALGASLATLALVVVVCALFDASRAGEHQFVETYPWIPQIGVSYAVGVNGIGLSLLALTAVLVPVCVLASWRDAAGTPGGGVRTPHHFMALVLVLESAMLLVFAARDVFLFYVLFEAMLIPMYFLIGAYGGAKRDYAAVKFLLYSLVGGLIMLVAVIGLYVQGPGGPDGFLVDRLVGTGYSSDAVELLLFLGFFFAFAVKAPMWPVHTWLPDAAAESPPGAAVLLVSVMDKVGTFGMLTLCLPLFPEASRQAAPWVMALAVVSILWGALVAIGQSDLKRLIAYTSVSHFGFIVLGIFALTTPAQNGASFYMVAHGLSTAALFLVAGMLIARRGSQRIGDYGGVQRVAPLLSGAFLVAGLSSLALPGLASFVGEFLVLLGTFARSPVAGVLATLGIVLAALYILLTYQRMMTGPASDGVAPMRDMRAREAWVVGPLVALVIALGVYPKPLLDVLQPAVDRTMAEVGATDPEPRVAVDGGASEEAAGADTQEGDQ